jgi:hypothetical protein
MAELHPNTDQVMEFYPDCYPDKIFPFWMLEFAWILDPGIWNFFSLA